MAKDKASINVCYVIMITSIYIAFSVHYLRESGRKMRLSEEGEIPATIDLSGAEIELKPGKTCALSTVCSAS